MMASVGLEALQGETVKVLDSMKGRVDLRAYKAALGKSKIGLTILVEVPCTPEHLAAIAAEDIPAAYMERLEATAAVLCNEYASTGLVAGRPVMAAGVIVHWKGVADDGRPCGYGEAWARVGDVPIRAWPAITRLVIDGLDRAAGDGIRLIETTVDAGFDRGHRWVRRLGFSFACPRPMYGVTGRDAILYQRVKGGV